MLADRSGQEENPRYLTSDELVPRDHPIRQIKSLVERALEQLVPAFNTLYSRLGRPTIAAEHLLKGSLLIALYSIRSERQFCERLQHDILFKWFLDLSITDPVFDPSTFSRSRARLLEEQVSKQFFSSVVRAARRQRLLSTDYFTVDSALLDRWVSMRSFRLEG